jgi:hypothetical protein
VKAPVTISEAKVVRPDARQGYERIFALGPDKVAVLNSYLITETYTFERIIDILKKEWGVFHDVKDTTLRRQLFRYKSDYILSAQAKIASKIVSEPNVAKLAAAAEQIQQNIDAVKTLEWAIQIQVSRVKKTQEQEDKLPTVMDTQSKNLVLLTQQLKELAAIQMDIGILKKVPAQIAISADLTEEERRFSENARVQELEAVATAEAIRYLREIGVVSEHPQLPAHQQTVEAEVIRGDSDEDSDVGA